mmetsp:Transcript_18144/g.42144  ORF Transcript_18144/g.42144 Transcript_18144/m.42144 type:complete len:91 (-) Transcript_18144:58-330(-)
MTAMPVKAAVNTTQSRTDHGMAPIAGLQRATTMTAGANAQDEVAEGKGNIEMAISGGLQRQKMAECTSATKFFYAGCWIRHLIALWLTSE